MLGGRFSRV